MVGQAPPYFEISLCKPCIFRHLCSFLDVTSGCVIDRNTGETKSPGGPKAGQLGPYDEAMPASHATVTVVVLDSVGLGALPDAEAFGDAGAHTLDHTLEATGVALPNFAALGLGNVVGVERVPAAPSPQASYGRLAERSPGKDTTTGHWEFMGVVLEHAFRTFTRFPEAAATQLFPPALGGWHDASLEPLAYDPEKAKALLAGLGWTAGEDGILEKDGERFSVQLRTFPDRPELPLMAAALQDQWRMSASSSM